MTADQQKRWNKENTNWLYALNLNVNNLLKVIGHFILTRWRDNATVKVSNLPLANGLRAARNPPENRH